MSVAQGVLVRPDVDDETSTQGSEEDQTTSSLSKERYSSPSTGESETDGTVWDKFFDRKKAEFADAVCEVELNRLSTKASKMKGRMLGRPPEDKTITIYEALDRVKDIDSFEKEVLVFVQLFSKKKKKDPNWVGRQMSRLRRGAERINEFQNGISSAVQFDPTGIASLSWGLILIVIQFSCVYADSADKFVCVLDAMSNAQKTFKYLEEDVKTLSSTKDLELKLLQIFDMYFNLCIAAIEYSTKLDHGIHLSRVCDTASRQPEQERNALKDKINTAIANFDRAAGQLRHKDVIRTGQTILEEVGKHATSSSQHHVAAMATAEDNTLRVINAIQELKPTPSESFTEATLPVQSLTMPRNEGFTGRKEVLLELHELLISRNDSQSKPASCCLLGIGGMGKTETALEFAYKFEQHWTAGIFWVAADHNQEIELLRTYNEIGLALGIVNSEEFDDRNVKKVRDWLQNTGRDSADKRWLIVFDGFTPGADGTDWRRNMDRIWPTKTTAAGCAIVVTSQIEMPSKYVKKTIPIDPLEDDEGLRILLNRDELERLGEVDRNTALQIVKELGGSSLFLNLAREFRESSGLCLNDYLNQICVDSNLPLAQYSADEISKDWRYSKAAYKAVDLTFPHVGTGLRDLLDQLAFMHHEDINEFILKGQSSAGLSKSPEWNRQYLENVHSLLKTGLVKVNTASGQQTHRSLRIHRAIQVALLMQLNGDPQRRDAALKRVTVQLRACYPEPSSMQIPNAVASTALRLVLPHVLNMVNCFERAFPKPTGDLEFARLVIDVGGMDCYDRGFIQESYRLNNSVKVILEPLEDMAVIDPSLSDALIMQGLCTDFMALNKREEGLEVRQKCRDIRTRSFHKIPKEDLKREDQVRLYNCYTDLSCSLQQINDFDGVSKLLDQCYERYREWGTEDQEPFEYSKYYNQEAYVFLYEGKNDKAVQFAKRAYELAELSAPGTNYPWLYKFDHANILWQHGDFKQEAFELMKNLIKDHSQELSVSYSEILNLGMEQNLGIMAYYLGELDLAESQLRALATRTPQCAAWPNENVVRGNYYLSQVLKAREASSSEGEELEKEAIDELMVLLKADSRGKAESYHEDYPIVFDYLMHWEFRLVTPRKPDQPPNLISESHYWWWRLFLSWLYWMMGSRA
ncbi:hypothetical protein HG530_006755 [Fusarium avenaceum]|nr:hypothetical protein HG530_006755 [Fusarium avenaceum]